MNVGKTRTAGMDVYWHRKEVASLFCWYLGEGVKVLFICCLFRFHVEKLGTVAGS